MLANEVKLDPRVKRTEGLLQKALVELLTEKAFHKITVQDITERAGVNRATFYDRFDDKYDLLNECVRNDFQARLQGKLSAEPALTRGNLRVLILTASDYLKGFIGHCAPSTGHDDQMMMLRQVQDSLYDLLVGWITASQSGGGQQPITPEIVARATSFAIFGSVFQWAQTGRKGSPEQLTEGVLSLLTAGLGAYLAEGV